MPRLLILDFDGTLADSAPWVANTLAGMADTHGLHRLSPAEMEELRGTDARTILRRLGIPAWRVPLLARHMRARMAREIDAIRLFPGIGPALARLHGAGVLLAVASSNAETNVRHVLGPHAAAVACFECGASLWGKAARFRRVLARTGVGPAEAICIGDELRDAEAAAETAIPFAAVAWGYNTPEALLTRNPVRLLRTPAELADLA